MAAGPVGGSGGAQTAFVLNLLTDLAFNMLIFFVVCASIASDRGRPQKLANPKDEKQETQQKQDQNIEILVTRTEVLLGPKENREAVPMKELRAKIAALLVGRKAEDGGRIVEVESEKDTPYSQWIKAAGEIEAAGGVITIRLASEEVVKIGGRPGSKTAPKGEEPKP